MKKLTWIALSVFVSAQGAVACSSQSDSQVGLAPVDASQDPGDADQDLVALGIDPTTETVAIDFDQNDESDIENPLLYPHEIVTDDDLSDLGADGELAVDPAAAAQASANGSGDIVLHASDSAGISAQSLNPSWWNQKYNCADPRGSSCVCRGSKYNCQFPNAQPGRNRILTQAQIADAAAAKTEKEREAIIGDAYWAVAADTTLYDGNGIPRGKIAGAHIRINYGQRKTIKDTVTGKSLDCVYAFSVSLTNGHGVSGWISRAAVNPHAVVAAANDPSASLNGQKYSFKQASDYTAKGKACTADTFDPETCLPSWENDKVVPGSTATNEKMGDYLLKSGNVINIIYSTPRLGGAATDTLIMSPELTFERAKSTSDHATILRIHLYPEGSKTSVAVVDFLYGKVANRFGWVAVKALKNYEAPPSTLTASTADGSLCGGHLDGALYCDPQKPTNAISCTADSQFTSIEACTATQHCETNPTTGKAEIDATGNVVCTTN